MEDLSPFGRAVYERLSPLARKLLMRAIETENEDFWVALKEMQLEA